MSWGWFGVRIVFASNLVKVENRFWTNLLKFPFVRVMFILLIYVSHIVEWKFLRRACTSTVVIGRFIVGNTLNCQHHIGEQFVEFAMLIFRCEGGRLRRRRGTPGGVGVGVLLVSCKTNRGIQSQLCENISWVNLLSRSLLSTTKTRFTVYMTVWWSNILAMASCTCVCILWF